MSRSISKHYNDVTTTVSSLYPVTLNGKSQCFKRVFWNRTTSISRKAVYKSLVFCRIRTILITKVEIATNFQCIFTISFKVAEANNLNSNVRYVLRLSLQCFLQVGPKLQGTTFNSVNASLHTTCDVYTHHDVNFVIHNEITLKIKQCGL